MNSKSKRNFCIDCGKEIDIRATRCRKCFHKNPEFIRKQKEAKQGKYFCPKNGFKKGNHPSTEFKRGHQNPNKNRTYEEIYGETKAKKLKLKLSEAHMGIQFGRNHPNWKGGYQSDFLISYGLSSSQWKKIATIVRKRDMYICQHCGKWKSYDVHHIIPRRITIDNDIDNLITLCRSCHVALEFRTNIYIEEDISPYEIFYGKTKSDKSKKTYVIDIDGTIVSQEIDYEKAKPFQDRIDYFNRLYEEGHRIIYWTARGYETGIDWRKTTLEQFKKFGIKFHSLRFDKISASSYIDDKGINVSDLNL